MSYAYEIRCRKDKPNLNDTNEVTDVLSFALLLCDKLSLYPLEIVEEKIE